MFKTRQNALETAQSGNTAHMLLLLNVYTEVRRKVVCRRHLKTTPKIGQICGKVAVIGYNCNTALNSRGLVEFALKLQIATSRNPGGSVICTPERDGLFVFYVSEGK